MEATDLLKARHPFSIARTLATNSATWNYGIKSRRWKGSSMGRLSLTPAPTLAKLTPTCAADVDTKWNPCGTGTGTVPSTAKSPTPWELSPPLSSLRTLQTKTFTLP